MMKLLWRKLLLFTTVLMLPTGMLYAAEITGTVLQTAGPYLLLQTESGQRVVRVDKGTVYGNMVGFGVLKYGGEFVRVKFSTEVAGVTQAAVIAKETEYTADEELLVTVDQLVTALDGKGVLLFDSRSRQEWDEARLFGAVLSTTPQELRRIPVEQGKGKDIVFYGASASDLRPFNDARQLLEEGYSVRVFAGGVKEWRSKGQAVHVSPSHVANLLRVGAGLRVIDLRDPPVPGNQLQGAEVLPVSKLTRSAVFLPERSFQLPLYLYGEEQELATAVVKLAQWGYHNDGPIAVLDPSWKEWFGKHQQGGYRSGALPAGEISYDEFRALWSGKDGFRAVLLNVKPKRDRDVPGEIHIPLEVLPERLSELSRDKEIIIYCSVGLRSAVAQQILRQNGFSSRFLNRILRFDTGKNPIDDLH
jgi:rhodanese-related sulfurtransferase